MIGIVDAMKYGVIALGLVAGVPLCAHAARIYYVDSMDGRDEYDGLSPQTAFRSLARVNELALEPGDSVLLRGGSVLDGTLVPKGRGAAGRPITIGMYGTGPMPRIDAHGAHAAAIHLRNTEYITVQDLHVTNYGEDRGDSRKGIFVDIEDFGTAREIAIRRNRVTNVNGELVKERGGTGIAFRNQGAKVPSRFDGLLIEHNHLARTERNGITGSSGHVGREEWFPSHHVVIRNNLLEEVPGDGIVPVGCDGAIVSGNVIRHGTPLLLKRHSAAAGIWPWGSDNTLIEFNEVSHHRAMFDGQGFDADWNCRGTIIQFNYSHHNDGGFLLVCNNGGSLAPWNGGNTGTIIRYNVSYNDGLREVDATSSPGHRAPAININGPVDGVVIHDNLFIVPRKTSPKVDDKLVMATAWSGWPKNVRLERNTFIVQGKAGFDTTRGTSFVYSGNVFVGAIALPAELGDESPVQQTAADPSTFVFAGTGIEVGLRLLQKYHPHPIPHGSGPSEPMPASKPAAAP